MIINTKKPKTDTNHLNLGVYNGHIPPLEEDLPCLLDTDQQQPTNQPTDSYAKYIKTSRSLSS